MVIKYILNNIFHYVVELVKLLPIITRLMDIVQN